MFKAIAITLLIVVAGCTPDVPPGTTAVPQAQCRPNLVWADWERKNGGQPGEIPHLNEELRLIFLRNFNSTPPASDYNPEKVYLINHGSLIMAFFVDGLCVTLMNPIPSSVVRQRMGEQTVKKS